MATANPRVGRVMRWGEIIQYVSTICAVAGVGAFSCYSNQRREAPQLLAVAAIERGARDRGTALYKLNKFEATPSLGRVFNVKENSGVEAVNVNNNDINNKTTRRHIHKRREQQNVRTGTKTENGIRLLRRTLTATFSSPPSPARSERLVARSFCVSRFTG
jgi:hypothetical protein